MMPLQHGLILAAVLFVLGFTCFSTSPQPVIYVDRTRNYD